MKITIMLKFKMFLLKPETEVKYIQRNVKIHQNIVKIMHYIYSTKIFNLTSRTFGTVWCCSRPSLPCAVSNHGPHQRMVFIAPILRC